MTPTQAQIEAAIIRLCDALLRQGTEQDGAWGWPSFREEINSIKKDLTAAAEVGERGAITGDPDVDSMTPGAAFSAGRSVGIATAIERCAQVADKWGMNWSGKSNYTDDIAAAIRALKDK